MEPLRNRNGGLTLVPMTNFVARAHEIKDAIEALKSPRRHPTAVDIAIPEFGERASGEPFVKLSKDHIGGHDCVILGSGPGTYKNLIQLQLALAYLVGRRAGRITTILGYLPLTRSDKDEGDKELALVASIIHLLEAASYGQLSRIIAFDLHAAQEVAVGSKPGLITEVSLVRKILHRTIGDIRTTDPSTKICIMFPDDGALKRFEPAVAKTEKDMGLELPVVIGQKRRTSSKNSSLIGISGDTDSVQSAHVIGVDDEIAGGGTSIQTAKAIKQFFGAKAYHAAVVHGVLCGEAPSLLADPACGVDTIYTSDTIPVDCRPELERLLVSNRLRIIPTAGELAEVIYRHHWDESIRSMR